MLNIDVKKVIRSRTVWVNLLVLIAGIATALSTHIAAGGAISLVAIVNLILRFLTTQALTKIK